ncbi:Glucose-6-phosphatase 3 [Sparganum proliferum]
MDLVHYYGVRVVQWLQSLPLPPEPFLFASLLGDPPTVTFVAFPLAFFLHPVLGVATILSAVSSEWVNGVLKWVFVGERPYWWVSSYMKEKLHLTQFPITCETGPGSPSGHCMVSVAGWLPLVIYVMRHHPRIRLPTAIAFGAFILSVSLSRLYVAAHFPHQVLGGLIGGALIGWAFFKWASVYTDDCRCVYGSQTYSERIPSRLLNPLQLLFMAVASFLLAVAFGEALAWMGVDINRSERLARQACIRPEWVRASTSLIAGYARISGAVLGLAIALLLRPAMPHCSPRANNTLKRILLSSSMVFILVTTVDALLVSIADILRLALPLLQRMRSAMDIADATSPDVYFLAWMTIKATLCPLIVCLVLPVMSARACIRDPTVEPPAYCSSAQDACPAVSLPSASPTQPLTTELPPSEPSEQSGSPPSDNRISLRRSKL